MYYVYVIQSLNTGSFYKGLTKNVESRLAEHNNGKTQSNRCNRPFRLIHVELCSDIKDARRLEKYFKSGSGREVIQEIYADVAELVYAYA